MAAAWVAACDHAAEVMPDGAPDGTSIGCDAPLGTQHELLLGMGDGIEDRAYLLHVPASYRCAAPVGLLVDFHGTAGDLPEEAYQTDALIALAEQRGMIVVRPRSRSQLFDGQAIYRWDQNPGDLERNAVFAKNLVADLERRYAIDPSRVYASGFSSGANMTARFLLDPASPFHGLAPIAGGLWTTNAPLPALASGPRVYVSTGYRDYLWPSARMLAEKITAAGLPPDRLMIRGTGGGHDLYAWQLAELWSFLDEGTRPEAGSLAAPWTAETLPSPADVVAIARDGTTLIAAGGHGRIWRRAQSGGWTLEADHGAGRDYVAGCAGGGRALVGGQYEVSTLSGPTWGAPRAFPDYGQLGAGWANAAVCRTDGSIIVAGYWSAALTLDGGQTWSRFGVPSVYPGVDAQIAGGAQAPGGATVLVGYYDYIGRAAAGTTTTSSIVHGATAEWWNAATAVAGGRFWVVGDGGAIVASNDDGRTFTAQSSETTENLYGVHFFDAQHGAAVGLHGTVIVTSDGGAHWTARPLGEDRFLGGVIVDAQSVTVVGEYGLVARSPRS